MTKEELIEKLTNVPICLTRYISENFKSINDHIIRCTYEAFLELTDGHELTIVDRRRGKYPYKIQTKIGELTLCGNKPGTEEDVGTYQKRIAVGVMFSDTKRELKQ